MTKATHATLVFVKGKGNVGKFTQGRSPPTPILGIHQQARQIMKQINPDHSLHEKNEISLREAISGSFGPYGVFQGCFFLSLVFLHFCWKRRAIQDGIPSDKSALPFSFSK